MEVLETITGLLQGQQETRPQGNKVESDSVNVLHPLTVTVCVDVHTHTLHT